VNDDLNTHTDTRDLLLRVEDSHNVENKRFSIQKSLLFSRVGFRRLCSTVYIL